jgi:hypothetical protein
VAISLRSGRPPAAIARWDAADVELLAAGLRIEERTMDRRFGLLVSFVAANGGVRLPLHQTFPSLAGEKVEVVDDGSRTL